MAAKPTETETSNKDASIKQSKPIVNKNLYTKNNGTSVNSANDFKDKTKDAELQTDKNGTSDTDNKISDKNKDTKHLKTDVKQTQIGKNHEEDRGKNSMPNHHEDSTGTICKDKLGESGITDKIPTDGLSSDSEDKDNIELKENRREAMNVENGDSTISKEDTIKDISGNHGKVIRL